MWEARILVAFCGGNVETFVVKSLVFPESRLCATCEAHGHSNQSRVESHSDFFGEFRRGQLSGKEGIREANFVLSLALPLSIREKKSSSSRHLIL